MTLVAGIDSSTQSCKVTVREVETGREVRSGKAPHPRGTVVDPNAWWDALLLAVMRAGGIEDVEAVSVSGQQHTPVFLDESGEVVCPSPLWNDTGSHLQMMALNEELGADEWIRRTGLPLTLSDTVTKVRWLRDTSPGAARRTAAVAIVHDWLTWKLTGSKGLGSLVTDRSEASGTGYWSPATGEYCNDLFAHAFGRTVELPRVLPPLEAAGFTTAGLPGIRHGIPVGVGSGDNAAAALALDIGAGDTVMSLGTSGVVYTRSESPVYDFTGHVCSYADATGRHLPLVATLNAARNFDAGRRLLGCTHEEFSSLALSAAPGAEGLTLLPYFEGERTPDLPDARGSLHGASLANFTRANFARAVIEGTMASQVALIDALAACGIVSTRLMLIGGGSSSLAVQTTLAQLTELPLVIPAPDEYVAKGAALQAACALAGKFVAWRGAAEHVPVQPNEPQIRRQQDAAHSLLGYLSR